MSDTPLAGKSEDVPVVRHRGLIAILALATTSMISLDATIANVALPHMQASLNAAPDTISWVLTSYLIAAAVATPLTGWLNDHLGGRNLIVLAVVGFTISSVLCGAATNVQEIVFFRIVQGAMGAFAVPIGQAVLLEIYTREEQGRIMGYYGMGAQLGPIIGPILGGVLTDAFNWRWVFYINLPLGIAIAIGFWLVFPKRQNMPRPFDVFGFSFLAIGASALQLMLDRGQRLDWFESTEIVIEGIIVFISTAILFIHMSSPTGTIPDRRLLMNRSFATGVIFMGIHNGMLSASIALAPQMLQHVFDYPAAAAGIAMAPRGVGAIVGSWVAGRVIVWMDPRLMMLIGYLLAGWSFYMLVGCSTDMDAMPVMVSGFFQGFAGGFCFVPMMALTFADVPRTMMPEASGLFAFTRNLFGALFVSICTTMLARNIQINHAEMAAHITTLFPTAEYLSAHARHAIATGTLDVEVTRQAALISYLNDYLFLAITAIAAIPLLLLMKWRKPEEVVADSRALAAEAAT